MSKQTSLQMQKNKTRRLIETAVMLALATVLSVLKIAELPYGGSVTFASMLPLAIIAYRQPVAKSEIEGIRGVTVDHVLRPLMEMHLVRIVGRSDLPGRPFLYGTTPLFLEHFGLRDLDELKDIDPTLKRDRRGDDDDLFKPKPGEDRVKDEKDGEDKQIVLAEKSSS